MSQVNFASDDLRNPKLVERIEWELDRQDLSADRLCVEVLETVMAGSGDDIIHRNLARLSDIGCLLDLDDFGTGHSSIAAIRRFGIDRLKIDRSFITKVDSEAAQNKMVRAIISMANELGIEALAEGVETLSEHAKLAQIGCHHVQGFGLAKPMPLEETHAWIRAHKTKVTNVQSLTQRFA
jgi:EAL domain-containing protein (putative c-di-GMP-specific phosphodiesterase class I)